MKTYYYKDGKTVRHITLNPLEYAEMSKKLVLFDTEKQAKKAK